MKHKGSRLPLYFISIIVIVCTTGCATEPRRPDRIAIGDYDYANVFCDWIVKTNMDRSGIPGCAVIVVSRDSVIFQNTYGIADTIAGTPVTAETFFRAGSLTKSLTALAVMKLSEEKKLDIDAPLAHYLPEFSIKSRFPDALPITPRMLMCHKSGLMSDYLYGIMGEKRLSPGELVARLGDEYASFPPLAVYMYSNTGYSLLGMLIERLSGEKYEDYVKKQILEPIGMIQSSLVRTPFIEARLAGGHMPASLAILPSGSNESKQVPFVEIRDSAAGSLITNISELGRYLQFFLNDKDAMVPRVIGNHSFSEMQKIQFPETTKKIFLASDYGLGLMRNVFIADSIHHSGNVNGFHCLMVFSPRYGIGMGILTNASTGSFATYDIVSRSFRHYLEAFSGQRLPSVLPKDDEPFPVTPEKLSNCTGRYAVLGVAVDIELRGDNLWLKGPSFEQELRLVPVGECRFKPVAQVLLVLSVEVAGFLGLDKAYARFEMEGERAESLVFEGVAGEAISRLTLARVSKSRIPQSFERFLGNYVLVIDERNKESLDLYLPTREFRLIEKNGWLVLESVGLPGRLSLTLEAVNDRQAVLLGSGETLSFFENEISFSGLKARRKSH